MSRLSEEYASRKNKLTSALKNNINPYPARTKRSKTIERVLVDFDSLIQSGNAQNNQHTLVGRIRTIRLHGGSCFAHIEDGTEKIQIYLKRDEIGVENYTNFKELIDIGDFIEVTGSLFKTKKGEKTLLVDSFTLLAKSLLPLPEKWHGLSDIEIRFRKRYLDLLSNTAVKDIFIKRSLLIKSIRKFLDEDGFMEVETPILQPIPGGANAKPFITHHNALDIDLYLRIAPELYLKRLIIGGFEKVYEIARCFRNEGIDYNHNPEFTQVEIYAAYWDYKKMMKFTEELFEHSITTIYKNTTIEYEGKKINFQPPYQLITFQEASKKYAKIDIDKIGAEGLSKAARDRGLDIDKSYNTAKILDEIFKELIRPNLIQPTFVIDYPLELSPLAKKKEGNPKYVERFQLVAAGIELCNAFSELNDPLDQAQRFKNQEKMRQAGDEEAQRIDEDFIEALAHGMPPTAGIGIGIDRLSALLNNVHNIKEVILFPTLKPKKDYHE